MAEWAVIRLMPHLEFRSILSISDTNYPGEAVPQAYCRGASLLHITTKTEGFNV